MYPILFELGSITIYSLWFFVTAAFVISSLTFNQLCKRNRVSIDLFTANAFNIFIVALIFGRITFVLLHWSLFFVNYSASEWLGLLALWDKGISFWGCILGALIVLYRVKDTGGEPIERIIDHLVPPILLGIILGSFGAFLDGSFYGTPTDLPWGITFRSAYVKYISDIHPTQLYSMLYTTVLLFLSMHLLSKTRNGRVHGIVTDVIVTLMSLCMFLEELIRGDEVFRILNIRIGLIVTAIVFFFGSYRLYRRIKNPAQYDPDGVLHSLISPMLRLGKKFHSKAPDLPVQ